MRKIIGIAAPARSGKDTVASILLQQSNVAAYALADPLKMGCQALFGLTDAETWQDDLKEKRIPLWAHSPREFFQQLGTDWMRAQNPEHWLMRAERAINATNPSEAFTLPPREDEDTPFKMAAQAFFGLSNAQTWQSEFSEINDEFWQKSPQQMFELIKNLTLKDFPDFYHCRAQRTLTTQTRQMPLLGHSEIILIKDIRFENEAEFLRQHNGIIWHVLRNNAQKVKAHASELGIAIQAEDVVIDNNGTLEQLNSMVEKEWQKLTQLLASRDPNESKYSRRPIP